MNIVGHGCPSKEGECGSTAAAMRGCGLRCCLIALFASLWTVAHWAQASDTTEAQENLAFEVRIVWGGGPVRSFGGTISLNNGSLEIVRNLSVQDDAVGTLRRRGASEVELVPHSASSFGGADLIVKGTGDSELQFKLHDPGSTTQPEPVRIKLAELLHERVMQPIDARGTRLAVERLAHDRIRASVNHGQTIMSPGERCSLTIEGYRNDTSPGQYRLNVRLVDMLTGRAVSTYQREVDVDADGSFEAESFHDIELPERPGAYCFEIGLQRRRLINTFINAISVSERRCEIIVVDKDAPPREPTQWSELAQIFPAGAAWWDNLGAFRIPNVKTLAPLMPHHHKPVGNADHGRRIVGTAECMVLKAGDWQAFPLHIEDQGRPHRLRIKAPGDRPQKLVFSIQESASPSDVSGLRLDSGLVIEPHAAGQSEFILHELVFWPKTQFPFLLVFNPDGLMDAAIAEVALEVAPSGLTSAPQAQSSTESSRLTALYYDKPLLTENFGAVRKVDSKGKRELDTWRTLYEASTRLADYTLWCGHNAAVVTVATQGGAIYPSQVLTPSPKFDSGTFLSDGSSPAIKDAPELLCREFDRRGLKLILAIELEGMLPDLMRFEASDANDRPLFQLPQLDLASIPTEQSEAELKVIRYNPLDARVQTALSRAVDELLERYAHHPSFAGIQINLSDRCHFSFAGDRWGFDNASLARFERSIGATLPNDQQQRQQLLNGALRLNFLTERSAELAKFYQRLAKDVTKGRPHAKLLINPAKLLSASPSAETFLNVESKSLTPNEILLGCGIDCAALKADKNICLLRPETDTPLRPAVARNWSYQLSSDTQLDAAIGGGFAGAIIQQMPSGFRLPEFDKANPLGAENPRTWLFPHASAAGDAARQALASRLYHADTQVLACGGWMALMGQETAMRSALSVLNQLPPVTMTDLASEKISPTLRVRRVEHAGRTYLQFVNNASWHETIELQLQSRSATTLSQLGVTEQQPHTISPGERCMIDLPIEAYGLVGVCIEADDITITSLRSRPAAARADRIERHLNDLQASIDRAGELNEQQTLGLRGGDFETWNQDGKPAGWTVSTHPSTSVSEERDLPRNGTRCVRIENNGNGAATAWIQSDRIAIPSTGRLALEVWVRSAPGLEQPAVRLSLIGRDRDGKRFQRWHDFIPSSPGGTQIPIDWGRRPLVLLVPDVPNEELNELYVAIDLIGAGRVWVDDVRVYGMYLHPDEQVHLLGQMFLAKEQLRKGDFTLADQLLKSFWACFLSTSLGKATTAAATTAEKPAIKEARLPGKPGASTPAWRPPSQPRLNQWQETLRQRWQR